MNNSSVLSVALEVKELLYQIIQARRGKWERAFVIASIASEAEMKAVANDLRAEIIIMPTTLKECIQRITKDATRTRFRARDIRLAEEWFKKHYG